MCLCFNWMFRKCPGIWSNHDASIVRWKASPSQKYARCVFVGTIYKELVKKNMQTNKNKTYKGSQSLSLFFLRSLRASRCFSSSLFFSNEAPSASNNTITLIYMKKQTRWINTNLNLLPPIFGCPVGNASLFWAIFPIDRYPVAIH